MCQHGCAFVGPWSNVKATEHESPLFGLFYLQASSHSRSDSVRKANTVLAFTQLWHTAFSTHLTQSSTYCFSEWNNSDDLLEDFHIDRPESGGPLEDQTCHFSSLRMRGKDQNQGQGSWGHRTWTAQRDRGSDRAQIRRRTVVRGSRESTAGLSGWKQSAAEWLTCPCIKEHPLIKEEQTPGSQTEQLAARHARISRTAGQLANTNTHTRKYKNTHKQPRKVGHTN